jgi:hydrogenase nickel incorporation protein HypA/HybF
MKFCDEYLDRCVSLRLAKKLPKRTMGAEDIFRIVNTVPGGKLSRTHFMHELSIAQSIVEAVQVEAARHPGSKPVKIGLRIGELSAVDPDALQFSIEAITLDTELQGLQVEIQLCPRRHRCLDCGNEFEVKEFDFRCPRCQSMRGECISGDQLETAYLELEEHEPSTT